MESLVVAENMEAQNMEMEMDSLEVAPETDGGPPLPQVGETEEDADQDDPDPEAIYAKIIARLKESPQFGQLQEELREEGFKSSTNPEEIDRADSLTIPSRYSFTPVLYSDWGGRQLLVFLSEEKEDENAPTANQDENAP